MIYDVKDLERELRNWSGEEDILVKYGDKSFLIKDVRRVDSDCVFVLISTEEFYESI